MKKKVFIILSIVFISITTAHAQQIKQTAGGYFVTAVVENGDTIPSVMLPEVYVFKPLIFKNNKQMQEYYRLVRNVKKTLPIAIQINNIIIETYEYMQTLPNEKERQKHLKKVEKGLKEQYTPIMKKLSFTQGKLLIKLINRQTDSSSYELVKAFIGPLKAGFYQTFAALFGASLKKEYDPEGEDQLTERVVLLVQSGQL